MTGGGEEEMNRSILPQRTTVDALYFYRANFYTFFKQGISMSFFQKLYKWIE
jgi:hypothetical protein